MAYRPGTSASETLDGTSSNDYFLLSGGQDTYNGMEGSDTLDLSDSTYAMFLESFNIPWGGTELSFKARAVDATITDTIDANGFEKVKLTDYDDEVIFWDDDVIWDFIVQSGQGNDFILTGGGDDALFGEAGNDTLLAGAGTDDVKGGQGNDIIGGDGGDDSLYGQKGNDVLWGDQFYEEFGPYPIGSDALYGGSGQDTLYFESTDTVVDGGGGWDTARVTTSVGVTLNLTTSSIEVAHGSGSADVFDASGKNTRVVIFGEDGQDTITGGNIGDKLYAGGDSDTLTGNGGNDRFYFPVDWGAANVITDFGAGGDNDKINFTEASIFSMADIIVMDMGADTLLKAVADQTETILLQNVDHNTINQWDFIFATPLMDESPSVLKADHNFAIEHVPAIPVPWTEVSSEMESIEAFGLTSNALEMFQSSAFDSTDLGLWDMF